MAELDTPTREELRFFNLAVGDALFNIQMLFIENEMGIKSSERVDRSIQRIAHGITHAIKSIGLLSKWLNIEGYLLYSDRKVDMWFHLSATPTYRGCLNTFSLLHDEPVQVFPFLQSVFSSNHEGAVSFIKLIIWDVLRVAGVENDPLRLLTGPEIPLDVQSENLIEVRRKIEHGLRLKSGGEQDIIRHLHEICVAWQLDVASTWETLSVKLDKERLRAETESKLAAALASHSGVNPNRMTSALPPVDLDPLIDLDQAAALAHCSRKTLANKRTRDQQFPPPDRPGNGDRKKNLWHMSTIKPYLEQYLGYPINISPEALARLARDSK